MSPNLDIELKPVIPKEYPTFIKNLQEAFSPAIIEKFGTNEYLPSKNDILFSLTAKNAEIFHIIYNNQCAGGVVLMIDKNTHHNSLDLFFISPNIMETAWVLQHGKPLRKISRYNHMENNYAIF